MSFGLRTWDANGVIQMDTDTFTYQVIHNATYQLTRDGSITIPIPAFKVANCVATVLPLGTSDGSPSSALPYQSVADGVVVVRSRNPSEADSGEGSAIQFRLLAMRYK